MKDRKHSTLTLGAKRRVLKQNESSSQHTPQTPRLRLQTQSFSPRSKASQHHGHNPYGNSAVIRDALSQMQADMIVISRGRPKKRID